MYRRQLFIFKEGVHWGGGGAEALDLTILSRGEGIEIVILIVQANFSLFWNIMNR